MTINRIRGALSLCLLLGFSAAGATTIQFEATDVADLAGDTDTWRYDYTVVNDTLGGDLEQFSVEFDEALYVLDSMRLVMPHMAAAPAGWDPLIIDTDFGLLPFGEGFYDALALGPGIAPGAALGGFSVTFDFLGSGRPGSQPFEVFDPFTFDLLDSGVTQSVPAPATLWLLGLGLLGVASTARRRRRDVA